MDARTDWSNSPDWSPRAQAEFEKRLARARLKDQYLYAKRRSSATATAGRVKALLQALVQRIDVESRAHIQPVFFVCAVRPPDGAVPPA